MPQARACMALMALGALSIGRIALAQTPGVTPVDPEATGSMAQRVQACTVCHGKEGRSTNQGYFPRIAGKPTGYLYNQLKNFQAGRRHNEAMAHLLAQMSDSYLREIATYFASLDLPYPPAPPTDAAATTLQRGAMLVTQGDAKRQIPACTQCHGDQMTGAQPVIPGLLGLPRDYLIAQLGSWQTGQRKATAPDCMATIANRLEAEDIGALAAWLSSKTPPHPAKPAASAPAHWPLPCGSDFR